MPDPRFFKNAGPFTINEIAESIGCDLLDADAGELVINDVAALTNAISDQVSFLDNRKYIQAYEETGAGVVIVHPELADRGPKGVVRLVTPSPYRAYALCAQKFYPSPPLNPGVHDKAFVHETASIGDGTQVDAGASIAEGAEIGSNCHIGANAVIERNCKVGAHSVIGATSFLSYCEIGVHANIHPGVRIGTRGFGFAMDPAGFVDVPQLGRVIIGDMVEIGANSTIDRGMGPDTTIGSGTKLDNMVHLGHNVTVGRACVLVGMTGIAGSTVLEDYVVTAAQSGIAGHLTIGKGAQIAGKSGVMRDVAPGEKVGGIPAVPLKQFFKQQVVLQKLVKSKNKKS